MAHLWVHYGSIMRAWDAHEGAHPRRHCRPRGAPKWSANHFGFFRPVHRRISPHAHHALGIFAVLGRGEDTVAGSAGAHGHRRKLYPMCGGDGGHTLAAECVVRFFYARSVCQRPPRLDPKSRWPLYMGDILRPPGQPLARKERRGRALCAPAAPSLHAARARAHAPGRLGGDLGATWGRWPHIGPMIDP